MALPRPSELRLLKPPNLRLRQQTLFSACLILLRKQLRQLNSLLHLQRLQGLQRRSLLQSIQPPPPWPRNRLRKHLALSLGLRRIPSSSFSVRCLEWKRP